MSRASAVVDAARRLARRVTTKDQRIRIVERQQELARVPLKLRALRTSDLDALARLHGTDKSSEGHDYLVLYRRHLGHGRKAIRRVLEIGVGGTTSVSGWESTAGGQSLRMWSSYFPNAEIIGIDIHAKEIRAPRIHFEQGDQSDPEFLRSVVAKHGPFDIVIDDGSHIGRHILASFAVLWDAVKQGGFYVIEDLGTAYHADWEGGPPGTRGTAAELIKLKIDDTLFREKSSFRPGIAAMHVYGEIVFFEKAGG